MLDYIYAVLHSPRYRETYQEYLKIDFPRVPLPEGAEQFRALATLGAQLRELHLLQSPLVHQYHMTLEGGTDMTVGKITKKSYQSATGRVYINDSVYFTGVTQTAWEFFIGGYQPAQKWLKDRTGRVLGLTDAQHYMQMIAALEHTARVMREIDEAY